MRNFSAHETGWLLELDGIELAPFWRRAVAFALDWAIVGLVLMIFLAGLGLSYLEARKLMGHPLPAQLKIALRSDRFDVQGVDDPKLEHYLESEYVHTVSDILVPVLYFGILLWQGNGRTPGKRVLRIRVVSIVHPHLTFWHSVERALGYGAAALEFGFGFVQFFIHPYRRCAQDRLAETIVVTEQSYRAHVVKHL